VYDLSHDINVAVAVIILGIWNYEIFFSINDYFSFTNTIYLFRINFFLHICLYKMMKLIIMYQIERIEKNND